MMISPELYVEQLSDKKYEELLLIRDELIESVQSYEEDPYLETDIMPGPEVVYQCELQYLGKLCELIAEKFRQERVWIETEGLDLKIEKEA